MQDNSVGILIKHSDIFIGLNDTFGILAVETMARENIDVLPVISKENNHIIGILTYHDIIAPYKHGIDQHEKKQPHISLKRSGLRIILRGKKLMLAVKNKVK